MDAISETQAKLAKYPELAVDAEATSIAVHAPTAEGFMVSLRKTDETFEVAFEGWHEDFDTEEEALNCFVFGLSAACRLKVMSRGGFDYKWTVESLRGDRWIEDSVTGLFFFPFWRRAEVRYLRNRVIPARQSAE